jgi:hypothetical protein
LLISIVNCRFPKKYCVKIMGYSICTIQDLTIYADIV